MMKPCLSCGIPSPATRCAECSPSHETGRRNGRERQTNTAKWQRFSRRLRKLSPFCELCGSPERLSVDHVIPYDERPDLEYTVENCRVLCIPCNSRRGSTCTDEDRAEVELRIAATKERNRRRATRGNNPAGKAPLTRGKAESLLHTEGMSVVPPGQEG